MLERSGVSHKAQSKRLMYVMVHVMWIPFGLQTSLLLCCTLNYQYLRLVNQICWNLELSLGMFVCFSCELSYPQFSSIYFSIRPLQGNRCCRAGLPGILKVIVDSCSACCGWHNVLLHFVKLFTTWTYIVHHYLSESKDKTHKPNEHFHRWREPWQTCCSFGTCDPYFLKNALQHRRWHKETSTKDLSFQQVEVWTVVHGIVGACHWQVLSLILLTSETES